MDDVYSRTPLSATSSLKNISTKELQGVNECICLVHTPNPTNPSQSHRVCWFHMHCLYISISCLSVLYQPLYSQHHRNSQPAGGAPLVRRRASTRLCMMYIAQGCSHTSRRPLDCVAGIRAAHHSGVPCIEIYSNINITRVTTPTNYLSYHAQ